VGGGEMKEKKQFEKNYIKKIRGRIYIWRETKMM